MNLTEKQLQYLINDLCVKLGFCLSQNVSARLVKYPPKTPEKFARSVIEAEGLNISTIKKSLYKSVLKEIENAFSKNN